MSGRRRPVTYVLHHLIGAAVESVSQWRRLNMSTQSVVKEMEQFGVLYFRLFLKGRWFFLVGRGYNCSWDKDKDSFQIWDWANRYNMEDLVNYSKLWKLKLAIAWMWIWGYLPVCSVLFLVWEVWHLFSVFCNKVCSIFVILFLYAVFVLSWVEIDYYALCNEKQCIHSSANMLSVITILM